MEDLHDGGGDGVVPIAVARHEVEVGGDAVGALIGLLGSGLGMTAVLFSSSVELEGITLLWR